MQVRWSGIPISFWIFQFIVIHAVKGFGIVNKAEKDVFLELLLFPWSVDVGNLISGSPAISKTSLSIWKFTVHIFLKSGLENFEHYFTSMWDECNCTVVWACFSIAFLWDWNENWPFLVLWPLLFSTFADILNAALSQHHLLGFEIAHLEFHHLCCDDSFVVVILPKAHLTSHSRMSGSRWEITLSWLSGTEDLFLYSSFVYSCHLFLISSASVRSIPFLSLLEPIKPHMHLLIVCYTENAFDVRLAHN